MQLLGKDLIKESYTGADGALLHQTAEGSYQFGFGRERQIVTRLEQVSLENFGAAVHAAVAAWLETNGPAKAEQAVMDRDVAEAAGELPGTLDAMAKKIGPEFVAQMYQLMKGFLQGKTPEAPASTSTTYPYREKVDGGWMTHVDATHKTFEPDGAEDAPLQRPLAPTETDGRDDDLEEEKKLVGVGAGRSDDTAEDTTMATAAKATPKRKR